MAVSRRPSSSPVHGRSINSPSHDWLIFMNRPRWWSRFPGATSELPQEPHVVFVEMADVGDAVPEHGDALDPDAGRVAGPDFRIVADAREDVGVDHAGAEHLDPAAPLADPAPLLMADEARHV